MDLREKRILVTGATGFLGHNLADMLRERGCQHVEAMGRSSQRFARIDLVAAQAKAVANDFRRSEQPEVIFHLAAKCAGIGGNQAAPYDLFEQNIRMGLNVIELALEWKARLVVVGSCCSYPEQLRMTTPYGATPVSSDALALDEEHDFHRGYPEPTNAAYGIAKRALYTACEAAHQQHGLDYVYVIPANLYGPFDSFNDVNKRHVIPALIDLLFQQSCIDPDPSGEVALWGTGKPTRDFLYVDDCARGLIAAAEKYDREKMGPLPFNLGSEHEISIADTAREIALMVGYKGQIKWDPSKPDGQPRRILNIARAREHLGWQPQIDFMYGLRRTFEYYLSTFASHKQP